MTHKRVIASSMQEGLASWPSLKSVTILQRFCIFVNIEGIMNSFGRENKEIQAKRKQLKKKREYKQKRAIKVADP